MAQLKNLKSTTTLNNGVEMPWVGLGVFQVEDGEQVKTSVRSALENGYCAVDTAAAYKNEGGVGEAIAESGVARQDIFLTSKLWNAEQGYDRTLRAFEESLKKLKTDYLDLYLIHWPLPMKGLYKDTWKAFEKLYSEKRIRAIGVSNFTEDHLTDLMNDSDIVPAVNQVEFHPCLTQKPLHEFCRTHSIQLEAWSPLMQAQILDNPTLQAIASAHGKSAAQVIIRWDLQNEVVTIPKSVTPSRIAENADVFDFELSGEEMTKIDGLNESKRIGPDPDTFDLT